MTASPAHADAGPAREPRADAGPLHGSRWAGLALFLALEMAFFAVMTPDFMDPTNLLNAGRALAILAIVATGATFGLISGALDISVGSVIALSGTVATLTLMDGTPAVVAIGAGIAVGLAVGTANGLIVVALRVNPIIATLAMMGIARGAAFIVSGGAAIVSPGQTLSSTDTVFNAMQLSVAGVPLPLILALLVVGIGHVVLAHTRLGRYAYAVGGNAQAGRAAAIPVDRLRVAFLAISGALAGLAGWVYASMAAGVGANVAQGYELTAITAVILGGAALAGGAGTMGGTLLGVLILGVMVNGLTLMGVPVFYQLMGQGLVLLLAVGIDARRSGGYR
jgi:ribose transport system permease protein